MTFKELNKGIYMKVSKRLTPTWLFSKDHEKGFIFIWIFLNEPKETLKLSKVQYPTIVTHVGMMVVK
jgi:hypothetical protein